ncbi:MAG: N-acetylmuramoyl-L-alanine amidase [Chloroflexota bacterium]|nr:N-acetylmuramoyl-L-alanine amidase [Chloroflexota bacterium]
MLTSRRQRRKPASPWRYVNAVAAAVLLHFMLPLAPPAQAQAGSVPGDSSFRVLLDAGHGGSDPGAISPAGGMQEKDVVLRVALLTGAALQRRGVAVVYTRTDDQYVALRERAAMATRLGASVMISLHVNSAPNRAVNGAEAWYGSGARDPDLAGVVLNGIAPALREYGVPVRGTRSGRSLAVLQGTVPSTLVELGYLSNAREATVLEQPAFHARVAEGLANGVIAFRASRAAPTTNGRAQQAAPDSRGAGRMALTDVSSLYFIRPGDTLQTVGSRFKIAVEELARLNPVADPQRLLPGNPLQLESGASLVAGWSAPASTSAAARPAVHATTYNVIAGDTLSGIALTTGVSVSELMRRNGLGDARTLRAGQTLRLEPTSAPATTSAVRATPAASGTSVTRRYLVQPGDTLSAIALRFRVSQEALLRANALTDPQKLLAGKTLVIPAAS